MTTAILSALAQEQSGLLAALQQPVRTQHAGRSFSSGVLHGQPVVLALSGIGKVAAATTASALIERFGATRIVFTGVAGGVGDGVNVGDVVKAGQVLATFAADTVQADVAQARASVMEAEANAAEAAANAERARGLQASGALSQQQIQQYTTAEQTAKARVEAARAQLNAQQLRLKFTQVLAPDSGVISARTATVGAVVGSGTELFRMVRKGRLEWRAEVTQAELARIRPGAKVQVTAASGAVGSAFGALAKARGCRVVGIAGGPDKCAYVTDELGFDACIDHKSEDFAHELAQACFKGVDIYFDNVGGEILCQIF